MSSPEDDRLHPLDEGTGPANGKAVEGLHEAVVEALGSVFDPEIPVNIYELGLVYNIEITAAGFVSIEMTLTSPGCPVAGSLPGEVESRVAMVSGVTGVRVELVWDPPWSPERMSEAAKLELGFL
ncbi:MAG: SUF system Fe-S cluster assembly protein [Acidobacteriota bacterium]